MAATNKIWSNGVAPTCEDDDLNGFKNENNNLIVGSGQGLSTADNQQTHKAVAHYAGVGDYFVDSGVADAYVLSVTGVQVAPPAYATGMRIRFVAGNDNTGASTVNVDGLGVKALVRDDTGAALGAGIIGPGETRAYYDGVSFRVTTSMQDLQGTFNPTLVPAGSSFTLDASFDTLSFSKIGKTVFVRGLLKIGAIVAPFGDLTLGNLPYPIADLTDAANTGSSAVVGDNPGATPFDGYPVLVLIEGTSTGTVTASTLSGFAGWSTNVFKVGTTLAFDFSYTTT